MQWPFSNRLPTLLSSCLLTLFTSTSFLFMLLPVAPVQAAVCAGSGDVTGRVFRDFNMDGSRDMRERGVENITISAYDASGSIIDSCETTFAGRYTVTVGANFPVRLEMTNIPAHLHPTSAGADASSDVVFLSAAGSNVNFGLAYADDYCQPNPDVAATCFTNSDPTLGGTAGTREVLVSFPYTAAGDAGDAGYVAPTSLAVGSEVGAVWGTTYQRSTQTLFTTAVMKRHAGFGPLGTGGIYAVDLSGGTPTSIEYFDLNAIPGINTGADVHSGLPANSTTRNHDPNAFDAVGKYALGGIDISGDDTLWMVNLFDRTLYRIENIDPGTTPTAADVTGFPIPDPGCTNSDYRPWAVNVYDGLVHVGVVCSAETSQNVNDLRAYILSLDVDSPTTFTSVYDFPLNYPRAYAAFQNPDVLDAEWRPWISTWEQINNPEPGNGPYGLTGYPQPILSDMVFDDEGNILVALNDRAGHQLGNDNYSTFLTDTITYDGISAGDLLMVCNINGTYELEGDAVCSDEPEAATRSIATDRANGRRTNPAQGPGRLYGGNIDYGEHFWQDMHLFSSNENNGIHHEVTVGSLAYTPIHVDVIAAAFDPVDSVRTGGVRWFNTAVGNSPQQYEIFGTDAGGVPTTFGSAAGIGDLELLCTAAPIEIGNRVWWDFNANGVQDADESPLAGVVVGLYSAGGTLIATATTDANGNYLFSNRADANIASRIYNLSQLTLKTDYTIGLLDSNFSGGVLNGMIPTTADVNSGSDADIRDSDGTTVAVGSGGTAASVGVSFTAGRSGENNPRLDFGFYAAELGDLPNTAPSYPTQLAGNGAVHSIYLDTNGDNMPEDGNAIWLGSLVDTDTDGQPTTAAGGDDGDGVDDEDGVTAVGPWMDGTGGAEFEVILTSNGPASGFVVGWLDFNADGVFDSVTTAAVTPGTNTINADVPGGTFGGGNITVHGRFRLFESQAQAEAVAGGPIATTAGFTGLSTNGEVEDYVWTFEPTAVSLQSHTVDAPAGQWAWLPLILLAITGVAVWRSRRRTI